MYRAITECFQKLNLGVEECCALIKPLNPCVSLLKAPGIPSAFKLLLLPWHLWCCRRQRGTESEMRKHLDSNLLPLGKLLLLGPHCSEQVQFQAVLPSTCLVFEYFCVVTGADLHALPSVEASCAQKGTRFKVEICFNSFLSVLSPGI